MRLRLQPTGIFKLIVGILLSALLVAFTSLYLEQPTAVYFNVPFSKNAATYVNNKPPLVLPSTICEGDNFIITFVTSAPNHFDLRLAIRETWGSMKIIGGHHIKTYFLMGTTPNKSVEKMVTEEYQRYDDIVLEDFSDTYYNLTIKSLMILKTVNEHCLENAKYVFKADDDVFVNLPLLVKNLIPHLESNYLFMGSEFTDGIVERMPWSKWYAPMSIYNESTYPPMLYGSAYVFSVNLVPKLLRAALDIPVYHLEDVYITGFLTRKLNISLTHNPHFRRLKVDSEPCKYINLTTTHYNYAEDYQKLFLMVYLGGDLEEQCRIHQSTLAFASLRFPYL